MKIVNKIEQLQLQQLNHDKEYHKDIYLQSMVFKLKHFTLHYSKYLSKLILYKHEPEIIRKILIDSFIISMSFANTIGVKLCNSLSHFDFKIVPWDERDEIPTQEVILNLYANGLLNIAKGLDNHDHFDDFSKGHLTEGLFRILTVIYDYIQYNQWSDFETHLLLRYQSIRDFKLL